MTTAPTPSDVERLAKVLRSACALSHPRFGTDARFVEMLASQAQAIEKELLRLQVENERLQGSLEAQRLISDRAIALAKELEARKPLPPDALADVCEAWLQAGGASNIVDAFEAGYRAAEESS